MENVTDSVSCNGSYASQLMKTAIYGIKNGDGYVANGSDVTVSNGNVLVQGKN